MQALNIALKLGRNHGHAALIGLHSTGGTHGSVQAAKLGGLGPHTEFLHFLGADVDLPRSRCILLGRVTLEHSDVIHAHRVFFGCGRGVRQSHRVAVVQQLGLLFGRFGGTHCQACGYRSLFMGHVAGPAQLVSRTDCGGQRDHTNGRGCKGFHKSSPKSFSISAKRTCASTWALSWANRA